MDYEKLSETLFPHIDKTPKDYEALYPPRKLPVESKVTRLGPSPTGFIHLGNLYGAFAGERLAHQSGGVFYLRIEDTDDKREVEGAENAIITSLQHFGIRFDEGVGMLGERGLYGPYRQSHRGKIYQCFAKWLTKLGLAYPCFCGEEELQRIRGEQEALKETPGYYGRWAKCRELSLQEVEANIEAGKPFVLRFRSMGNPERSFQIEDGIRGSLSMPENFQDVVLLKQNGIPTYHFAHVIDDHLMRTTHVLRGEEWLSSLPIHIALFGALGWKPPIYCHTTVLMKMEDGNKRKLSKRKDPELSLDYYRGQGYHPWVVREYLLTILNSNFEEWRMEHPLSSFEDFDFTLEKMSSSGTLFDLDKLNDISKDVLVKMSANEIYDFLLEWAKEYRNELAELFVNNKDMMIRILDIERGGEKPRKDLMYGQQIFEFISYFFDAHYVQEEGFPDEVDAGDLIPILKAYLSTYDFADDQKQWFDKIRTLAENMGYAAKPKDFKKQPEKYKGHVGHVSTVIRIAIMGRSSSPDLWQIQQIMGVEMIRRRIEKAISALEG
ncbi:MAG: glutamate--tRNA ligase [Anaerovoracaceae bacterium]|jgi:glutamyl-tRNA synthetase